jgi:ubiquinone/menaquinone biosynthesis C-methylase UbiE
MSVILIILLSFLGLFFFLQVVMRVGRKIFHFPAPAFMGRLLDSNYRRRLQRPSTIIARSGIRPGMKAIEVGCGSGAYTLFTAAAVGKAGKIYALDIQEKMLAQIRNKIERNKDTYLGNIELLKASAYAIPLPDNSLDLAYMITVLQEIPDKQRALAEIRRVLKPGGIIAVTELLPDPDYPFRSKTKRDLAKAGFVVEAVAGMFWTYTVRAIKK